MSARIFHEASGETRGCTIIRDVTDRVAMEHDLREVASACLRLSALLRPGAGSGTVPCDRVSWSDGLFHIYGSPRTNDLTLAGGEERVYPDDRARVRETVRQAVAERSSFTLEYRAVCADGRVRTLRNRAEVVVDLEAGEPIRVVGIAEDVTDAKLAEEALRSTSSDLERRAIELQKTGIPHRSRAKTGTARAAHAPPARDPPLGS